MRSPNDGAGARSKLRVIRPSERTPDERSGPMLREAAISHGLVGAERLWLGWVELPPGLVSSVHHHGEAESGIFIMSGRARFVSGEGLDQIQDAEPGDFVWVPPHEIHVELNRSDDEAVRMVVARSTRDALVFNLPTPPGWSPPP